MWELGLTWVLCVFFCFQMVIAAQDDQLALVGQSVKVLKVMGQEIGNELDDQNQ